MNMPKLMVFQSVDDPNMYVTAFGNDNGKLLPMFMQFTGRTEEEVRKLAADWWNNEVEKAEARSKARAKVSNSAARVQASKAS